MLPSSRFTPPPPRSPVSAVRRLDLAARATDLGELAAELVAAGELDVEQGRTRMGAIWLRFRWVRNPTVSVPREGPGAGPNSRDRATGRSPWYFGRVRRDTVIAVIRAHLPEIRQRFGVRDLSVFGSVARDESTGTSDVDVLIEFDGPTTFDGYFGLKERLEEVLGTRVDLATPAMLKPRLKVEVEREGVRVA